MKSKLVLTGVFVFLLFSTTFLAFEALAKEATQVLQIPSFTLSSQSVKQGDILIVILSSYSYGFRIPRAVVRIFDKNFEPNNRGIVYVGIDPKIKPGKYKICWVEGFIYWYCAEVRVAEKAFSARKVINRRTGRMARINPLSRAEENIRFNDGARIQAAYLRGNSRATYINSKFVSPLGHIENLDDVLITDPFGFRIYANGRTLHRGVDLKTVDANNSDFHKRPVKTVNSGRVVLADNNFLLEGNLLIIDHGSGIFSLYMHLDSFTVKEGDFVQAGQQIGISGATGRVSGPHLHFAVRVNGTIVDPLDFINTMNQLLK